LPNARVLIKVLGMRLLALRTGIRRWIVRIGLLGVVFGAVQYVSNTDSRVRYLELRVELNRLHELNHDLTLTNEKLRMQVQGIQHDDRYLEQIAREEFGMIQQNEVLYHFVAERTHPRR